MNQAKPTPKELFTEATQERNRLLDSFQTVILSTLDSTGEPNASYAPCAIDEDRNFYIYVSSLAKHTDNLMTTGKASLMIIEDESAADTLFTRKRLTLHVKAEVIERDNVEWEKKFAFLENKFARILGKLKTLADFSLFRLVPSDGILVYGFGRAFRIFGERLEQVGFMSIQSSGHRSVSVKDMETQHTVV